MNIIKYSLLICVFFLASSNFALEKDNSDCLDCHSDKSTTKLVNGKEVSLYVNEKKFTKSVHGDLDCVDCHEDFDAEEIPHKAGKNIAQVDCSNCHDTEEAKNGIHGKNLKCSDCHSKHNIQPAETLKKTGEKLCLSCHKSHNVQGYTQSIHYKSRQLGKKAPTCTTCHGSWVVTQTQRTPFGVIQSQTVCPTCKWKWKTWYKACENCNGKWIVMKEQVIEVDIPVWTDSGTKFRMPWMGHYGYKWWTPWDLYVGIIIDENSQWKKSWKNIIIEKEINVLDAILWWTMEVELPDKKIKIKIPKWLQVWENIVVNWYGFKKWDWILSWKWNLIIKPKIIIPKKLSKKEKELYEQLKK